MAVRKLLRRMGWKELGSEQTELALEQAPAANPNLSAFCSPDQASPSTSQDQDPTDRRGDRLLAYLGLLDDAPPLFGSGASIPPAKNCVPKSFILCLLWVQFFGLQKPIMEAVCLSSSILTPN
jgi:hypothetical protein